MIHWFFATFGAVDLACDQEVCLKGHACHQVCNIILQRQSPIEMKIKMMIRNFKAIALMVTIIINAT